MSHLSEGGEKLGIENRRLRKSKNLRNYASDQAEVYLITLPVDAVFQSSSTRKSFLDSVHEFLEILHQESVVCFLAKPEAISRVLSELEASMRPQLWVAVKSSDLDEFDDFSSLERQHTSLVIFTKYQRTLCHTKTRIGYTYCPYCEKTTKDYGGKKHTYNSFGTLMSDVWRDIKMPYGGNTAEIEDRLADVFGLDPYRTLRSIDLRLCSELSDKPWRDVNSKFEQVTSSINESELINADCMSAMKSLPDDSIDFCFADPPYNLSKKYDVWDDEIEIVDYFRWCDEWITELARILKPGRTCAILNIPFWAARHFQKMDGLMNFQSWIAWEALSLPVRLIMPAHYVVLCFSKGHPRDLPGLTRKKHSISEREYLHTLKEFYCVRTSCIKKRKSMKVDDSCEITDLWWDTHRLKHNSRRVDHPCQLPPKLMLRLISLFTNENESVLDPFNGAGTTTLCAELLNRKYIGIELSAEYHDLAQSRHMIMESGEDPFAKRKVIPKSKNSRVKRLPQIKYAVPKKYLQMEVKTISQKLGRLPSREEVAERSKYPIEYFDEYFVSWGEVCAAARTDGMTENKQDNRNTSSRDHAPEQLHLFQ